jgi:peptidoglycan/LPS O-acetylase OafA/YrhL
MARITYLDGLRGAAALMVVVHHFALSFYPGLYWPDPSQMHTGNQIEGMIHGTPLSIVTNGGLAVAVFLVMSGYVLMMHFVKKGVVGEALAQFSVSRFMRFFGLLLSVNLLAFLIILAGGGFNQQAGALTGSGWLASQWQLIPSLITALTQSVTTMFYMYPIGAVYNSSAWTMPLFFLGGLLVALLYLVTYPLRWKWVIYALVLVILLRGNYYLLVVGMMLYEFGKVSRKWMTHPVAEGILLLTLIYFGGYPYFPSTAAVSEWYAWLPSLSFTYTSTFYHGMAAVALMLLVMYSGWVQRLFSWKVLSYFGSRSFSLYVLHVVLILSLSSWLFLRLIPTLPYSQAVGGAAGASLVVIFGLAELLFRGVENRSSGLATRLYQWLSGKGTITA